MTTEIQIEKIEALLSTLLMQDPEYFLVRIRIKPTNNIRVYIDGDKGLTIEKCIQFNRHLYKLIEEAQLYIDGDYSLEVSSPGIDEPLLLQRQYVKNIGREVELELIDATKKTGVLTTVTDNDITIETISGKGKKQVKIVEELSFDQIKKTIVQIKF